MIKKILGSLLILSASMVYAQSPLIPAVASFPVTSNIFSGNGSGGASDSGIAPANVALLNAANVFTNNQTISSATKAILSLTGMNGTFQLAEQSDFTITNSSGGIQPLDMHFLGGNTYVVQVPVVGMFGFNPNGFAEGTNPDTGMSRCGAACMSVGNGTLNDATATIKAGIFNAGGIALTPVLHGTLTYTTATTDVATVTGITSSSHCWIGPTNTLGATGTATAFISTVATNAATVTHVATTLSGGTVNVFCSLN